MSVHAYPVHSVLADYLRAGIGLVLSAVPFVYGPMHPVMTGVLGGLFLLFSIYALRTVLRHLTRVEIDEKRIISRGPRPGELSWSDLSKVRLAYYSTRRDGTNGWLQLNLSGGRARLNIDSNLDGFEEVASRTAAAVAANELRLDSASAKNFATLGLTIGKAST